MVMSAYAEYFFRTGEQIESHSYLLSSVRRASRSVGADCRVVDLGCGNGDLLAALKQPNWLAQGVDLSPTGIAQARLRHHDINFHLREFDDSLVTDLGAASLDLVISTEVIEHLYTPRELFRIAFQLLRPGGLFVISTPYHGYFQNCALALTGKLDEHFNALTDCGHIKFWSYRTLVKLFQEAGFLEIRFRGAGRLPWLWKSMVVSARRPA
jgi:2-polyprenyl-6-hydroxyphenyl methylase/3-demethylubiquinone-9 3-methyltransferase